MARGGRDPGARTVGAIADVIAQTLTKHKAVTLPVEKAAQARFITSLLEDAEGVYAKSMREILGTLADHPDLPPEVRQLLGEVTNPSHQWQFLLSIAAEVGYALGVVGVAAQPWLRATQQHVNRLSPNVPLTPEQLAAGWVRGVVSGSQLFGEGGSAGLNRDHMAALAAMTGNPPGTADLLEAYRRGLIGKGTLEHGIQQGDLRNEWTSMIERMRYSPVDPSTAVQAAVQSVLSTAAARKLAAEGGLDPGQFDIAYRVAGSPPGIQEAADLWARGVINQAGFDQIVRESRTKTKYLPALRAFKRTLLPADTIASMAATNVISRAAGMRKLLERGYSSEDAAAWIERARKQHQEQTRDLSKSEVLTMYANDTISRAKADGLLQGLGYDRAERGLLLANVDTAAARELRDATVSRLKALYVAWRIDQSQVASAMDQARVPPSMRNKLLRLWALERDASHQDLTKTEIVSAYGHGIFTLAQAKRRLEGIGYHGEDAAVILAEHAPAEVRDRTLTTAQVIAAFKRGALSKTDTQARLADLGYDQGDVAVLLHGVAPQTATSTT